MSIRDAIYKQYGLLITTGEGYITAAEIQIHQDHLLSDPAFDPKFDQLIDVTTAVHLDMTAAEAKEIAWRPIVSPNSRRAFAATSIHIFALCRLMEIQHEAHNGTEVQIFTARHEALKWLRVPEDSGLY